MEGTPAIFQLQLHPLPEFLPPNRAAQIGKWPTLKAKGPRFATLRTATRQRLTLSSAKAQTTNAMPVSKSTTSKALPVHPDQRSRTIYEERVRAATSATVQFTWTARADQISWKARPI